MEWESARMNGLSDSSFSLQPSSFARLFLLLLAVLTVAWGLISVRRMEAYRTEMSIWRDALQYQPADPMVHCGLGVATRSLGQSRQAMEHFQDAVRLDPKCAQAHVELAGLYYQAGQIAEAMREYEKAAQLHPD